MRAVVVAGAFLLFGCGGVHKPVLTTVDRPEISIPAKSQTGLGHVCPVGPRQAYTARHVSTVTRSQGEYRAPLVYDIGGVGGTLLETVADLRRDVSIVEIQDGPDFPRWHSIAATAPASGDIVLVQGYDPVHGLARVVGRYTILEQFAGSFTYDGSPGPGSSGSCVILERTGELVGINVARYSYESNLSERQGGIAWSLWGPWQIIPTRWQR